MEDIEMKKYLAIVAILALAAAFCVSAEAAADKTASVSASVSITGSTSLSVSPSTITYGTFDVDAFPTTPADKKVVLTYNSNYSPWKIAIYTNNTQVKNYDDGGSYAKGGLATASGSSIIPLKWVSKKGDNTVIPSVPTFTSAHNFVKDIRDEDDTTTGSYNESWADAYSKGYANIAYGTGPGAAGYCVDPTNTTPGANQYKGDAVDGSIAVYLAGLFGTGNGAAGEYSASIYFDLYHE